MIEALRSAAVLMAQRIAATLNSTSATRSSGAAEATRMKLKPPTARFISVMSAEFTGIDPQIFCHCSAADQFCPAVTPFTDRGLREFTAMSRISWQLTRRRFALQDFEQSRLQSCPSVPIPIPLRRIAASYIVKSKRCHRSWRCVFLHVSTLPISRID